LKRGKRSGGQNNGECQTRITSNGRGKDWGGGEKEGRVGDFRELDRSANEHEFSLGWIKREKVKRHPVSDVREKETDIVDCRFEGFRRRRERYVQLCVVVLTPGDWLLQPVVED
jgi:hypothetical protein